MTAVDASEKMVQDELVRFFRDDLGYAYLGNWRFRENNRPVEETFLREYLSERYGADMADEAVRRLQDAASLSGHDLYTVNKAVYELLRSGTPINPDAGQHNETVHYIDWENPASNRFGIAEEVTVVDPVSNAERRPDLVLYVNGIALAVIELKNSATSVQKGISQLISGQHDAFIPSFFTTVQFCLAANPSEGVRYGTTGTPAIFYNEWKADGFRDWPDERDSQESRIQRIVSRTKSPMQQQFAMMCSPLRFLDLVRDFVIFDAGVKKVCRYNQFYGMRRAASRIASGRGGIIWHTQGSGKSLTMVWLARWILEHVPSSRVLVITDRDELDKQITKNFNKTGQKAVKTMSGADLIKRLNSEEDSLICSLVHKFGRRGGEISESDIDRYIADLRTSLPGRFRAKGKIVVFVDECHRSHSGKMHAAMKAILPDAVFIGFTGTPLLKADKDRLTSMQVFGSYIHTYKFDEGVRDGVVLDLCYEARNVSQDVKSPDRIDAWFDAKTRQLNERSKERLKARWATVNKVFSSRSRLVEIAKSILFDFETKPRLKDGRGNAMLVADSIYSAFRYWKIFREMGLTQCAVISSYEPDDAGIRTAMTGDKQTEEERKYELCREMIGDMSVSAFEEDAKDKFVKAPAQMKLLIVVDKLLTGFDAPPCTYLYIDRQIQDHALFQAICRVNRLDDDTKSLGFIVDFQDLFGKLRDAMQSFTGKAFEKFDPVDIQGLLKHREEALKEKLSDVLEKLDEICEPVAFSPDIEDYCHYFCGTADQSEEDAAICTQTRERLYNAVSSLVNTFNALKPDMLQAGYSEKEIDEIKKLVKHYVTVRKAVALHCGEAVDLGAYDPEMRFLIDNYLSAEDATELGSLNDMRLLDMIDYHLATEADKVKELTADGHQRMTDDHEAKVSGAGSDTGVSQEGGAVLSGQNGNPQGNGGEPDGKQADQGAVSGGMTRKEHGVGESIEHQIRKKIVAKTANNPALYEAFSERLLHLIDERKKNTQGYADMLARYRQLVLSLEDDVGNRPDTINTPGLRTLYDNTGKDESLALAIHQAVMASRQDGFRDNSSIKARRVKREIRNVLPESMRTDAEVERIFSMICNETEY